MFRARAPPPPPSGESARARATRARAGSRALLSPLDNVSRPAPVLSRSRSSLLAAAARAAARGAWQRRAGRRAGRRRPAALPVHRVARGAGRADRARGARGRDARRGQGDVLRDLPREDGRGVGVRGRAAGPRAGGPRDPAPAPAADPGDAHHSHGHPATVAGLPRRPKKMWKRGQGDKARRNFRESKEAGEAKVRRAASPGSRSRRTTGCSAARSPSSRAPLWR